MNRERKEILIYAVVICLLSAASTLFAINVDLGARTITVTYSADKMLEIDSALLIRSLLSAVVIFAVYFAVILTVCGNGKLPKINKKNALYFGVLAVFGVLADAMMSVVAAAFKINVYVSVFISSIVSLAYLTLIYELYFKDKINSNAIIWEIIRFAIVGAFAAAFDFSAATIVQFLAFKGSAKWFVTPLSTACGFAVGVTINYILSTYMVYKNAKTALSKSVKGVMIFVALSAVGLFIGIGLQYLLYDVLYLGKSVAILTYPVDFVIRTLVVMVYNYVSRKLIIYK